LQHHVDQRVERRLQFLLSILSQLQPATRAPCRARAPACLSILSQLQPTKEERVGTINGVPVYLSILSQLQLGSVLARLGARRRKIAAQRRLSILSQLQQTFVRAQDLPDKFAFNSFPVAALMV
jgi:hypothetical protein